MTKVYLVELSEIDAPDIIVGVFSTFEKAEESLTSPLREEYKYKDVCISEMDIDSIGTAEIVKFISWDD